jgi:hypothetical protein
MPWGLPRAIQPPDSLAGEPIAPGEAQPDVPPAAGGQEPVPPLQIHLTYDRQTLAVNDQITARGRITLNGDREASMVLVDLGVPPGFTVETADLEQLVTDKIIQRYELTGRQIILYIEKMQPKASLEVAYRLQARYPLKAKTPPSTAYDYYNPETQSNVMPVQFVVQ